MKQAVLMVMALNFSLPAMASEKVIEMYQSENCGCCSWQGTAICCDVLSVTCFPMPSSILLILTPNLIHP